MEPVADDAGMAKQVYNFADFATLEAMNKENTYVDICAVVREVGEQTEITTKKQKQLVKRELEVMDRSTIAIRLTLWGKSAEDWSHEPGSIIAVKAASLNDFNGCSMSVGMSSKFEVRQDTAHLRFFIKHNSRFSRLSGSWLGLPHQKVQAYRL